VTRKRSSEEKKAEEKMAAPVVAINPHAKEDTNSYVGIVVALASWGMMFAGIFFIYAALRARAPEWPPLGMPRFPTGWAWGSTAAICASSVAFDRGLVALRAGNQELFKKLLSGTIVLGCAFLQLQLLVWMQVRNLGVYMTSGVYGSIFFGFTYLHAAHIVAGLMALAWVQYRARKGHYTAHNWFNVRSVAYFWHFVGAVWIVMFVTLFLF
jgi:cytochrome c oxidase subunit 3